MERVGGLETHHGTATCAKMTDGHVRETKTQKAHLAHLVPTEISPLHDSSPIRTTSSQALICHSMQYDRLILWRNYRERLAFSLG